MPDLGKKYTCYSCHTKFYDLGKAVPLCPKCGADQRDAEEAPVVSTSRRSAPRPVVVEEPAEEEFSPEVETPVVAGDADEEEEIVPEADREEEPAEEEEDEEY